MKPNVPSTILIVDDEAKARTLLRGVLEAEGYAVLSAASGPEALEAARALPDVVLLDLMMPGMDGYEVCEKLRAEPALGDVPIIMLTALDDRASRLRGLQAGADDFLSKPFDSAELRARLRTITRLNRYRRLFEERARFESAIAHAPEGIVLAERDGTILSVNTAFTALLDPAAQRWENFFAYLAPANALELRQAIGTAPGTAAQCGEFALNFARRPQTIVEISHGVVPWQGRTIVQFHLRDLTEKKLLEAQLLRSQRIELLGQLAGSVIHDLNNILAAIGGSVTLLDHRGGSHDERLLQNVQSSVQRGSGLLRQLLGFARGSDGEMTLLDPNQTVTEVAELVGGMFGRHYEVTCQTNSNIQPVEADSTQLHQILMNLCVNARDAMPEGGRVALAVGQKSVSADAAREAGPEVTPGDYVWISVRDSGTGIPPEIIPKLFDPFFTTKPQGQGTGLGLATVMRLVRRHRGFVTLETAVGQGTCFTCHLPVVGEPAPATTAPLTV